MTESYKVFNSLAKKYKLECLEVTDYTIIYSKSAAGFVVITSPFLRCLSYNILVKSGSTLTQEEFDLELADPVSFQKLENIVKQIGDEHVKLSKSIKSK